MQATHDSLQKQIADAERAVWSGDERRRELTSAFKQSARQGLKASRGSWLIGGLALAGLGFVLFPRRKAVLGLMRTAVSHPLGLALLERIPMVAMVLPWLKRLSAR